MRHAPLVFFLVLIAAAGARAEDPAGHDAHAPGLWDRDTLTGDWGGARTALGHNGLNLGATYIGETLSNVSGGIRRRTVYDGRLEIWADVDLDKFAGWAGATIHANAYQIHGRQLSQNSVGTALPAGNIEAANSTRLFTAWFQQNWDDDRFSFRIGQIAADDEFIISPTAANFMNTTFGWLALATLNLPDGGPIYPLGAPGLRFAAAPVSNVRILSAIFSGDPAGEPNGADPGIRNPSGTNFSLSGGVFVINEVQYLLNQAKDASGLPGVYKLGGWYHSAQFNDQRFDMLGRSLAAPASNGTPAQHRGSYAIYAVADQMVWRGRGADDPSVNLFMRIGGAPADTNLIEFYAEAGAGYKGLIPGRGDDTLYLGAAYAKISGDARGLDQDTRGISGVPVPLRDFETIAELSYVAQIAPWWNVQPDVQYFVHPGGHVADPNDPTGRRAIPDAIVLGLRTTIKF